MRHSRLTGTRNAPSGRPSTAAYPSSAAAERCPSLSIRLNVAADSVTSWSLSATDISRSESPATLRWVRSSQPTRAATSMRDAVSGVRSSSTPESLGTGDIIGHRAGPRPLFGQPA